MITAKGCCGDVREAIHAFPALTQTFVLVFCQIAVQVRCLKLCLMVISRELVLFLPTL